MKSKPSTLGFAFCAVLVACGGGDQPPPALFQASIARARIQTDTARIDSLFELAERTYAVYFPSHRQNQFLAPYTFRYYPETQVYLGVADDNVYVMGGPFGSQPVKVGQVADFLPAAPQRPVGTGNGCWDLDFMETPGRQIVVESRSTTAGGTVTGSMTQDWTVLGLRVFEGQTLLATDITVSLTTPTGVVSSVQRTTSWTQRASNVGVTVFGDEGSLKTGPVSTSFRTVFSPPWTDMQYGLEPGQSLTQTWTGTSTSGGTTAPLQGSRTVRFVARETLTVAAGTFETCRFEQTQPSTPVPVTTWIARGWGVPVQLQSTVAGQTTTTRAQRITVDGAAVTAAAAAARL